MTNVTVLGSTGSIGVNTLDVVRRRNDRFRIFALAAGTNSTLLAKQIAEFRPRVAVVSTDAVRRDLQNHLRSVGLPESDWPELLHGPEALVQISTANDCGFVLSAIVGVAGLEATYEAVRKGKRLGLANKEVMVASGTLVTAAARASGAAIIPVDSEHNGAHQCLRAGARGEVVRLILTASGGPFRETPIEALVSVTPEQALNHPTWRMGKRITIDSATLMNKGFEVIEACWLFDLAGSEVDVVVHPQSTVHAMVEYVDGSIIAQVSATDMRMPIQYALTYPERDSAPVPRLDWTQVRIWDFAPPDFAKFPLLGLAYEAHAAGGSATCTLNAADEIAVEAFLNGRISFPAISHVVRETLERVPAQPLHSISDVMDIDHRSRHAAREVVKSSIIQRPLVKA